MEVNSSSKYPPPYPTAAAAAAQPGQYGQYPQQQQQGPSYPPPQAGGFGSTSPYPMQQPGRPGVYYHQPAGGVGGGSVPPIGFQVPASSAAPVTMSYGQQDGQPKPNDEAGFKYANDISNGMDFSEKSIRMAFIRKVYTLLSIQLCITVGLIALFIYHPGIRSFTRYNPVFYLCIYVVFIVTLFTLVCPCCSTIRRKTPSNYICLSIFTIATGMLLGVISARHEASVVILAIGTTVLIVIGLTIFSFQTKWDFTRLNGILFVVVLVFIIFGILTASLRNSDEFPTLKILFAGIGVLIFSIYLVHDTQLMIGGKHKYALSPEEYIFATLNIYLDVILIFLYLLQIFDN